MRLRSRVRLRVLLLVAGVVVTALAGLAGCKSYESDWIETTVENRTGAALHELEVDYPSASFGTNNLAEGASYHYRFQIRGSGPVKVDYNRLDGKTIHAQGLNLTEHQHGQLVIVLLPDGKVKFLPTLQPAS